jgi:hypothetical protein
MSADFFQSIYEKIIADPLYQVNILYGKPRSGHSEGTVKAHIADLEANLAKLVEQGLVEADSEQYWQLKVLIHVHDSFKAESKRNCPILDPQSHASIARAYLAQYTKNFDMLQIVQFHDLNYALYQKRDSDGNFDEQRFLAAFLVIRDLDLLLLFTIIDGCTPSKGRKTIRWFVDEVVKRFPTLTRIRTEHIIPGNEEGTR